MPLTDCLWLLAVGAVPLLVLEMVKLVRNKRRRAVVPAPLTGVSTLDLPRELY